MLLHGQIIKQPWLIGEERQFAFGRNGVARQVMATNPDRPARRRDDAGKAAQGRCFAGPIGPNQAKHLSELNGERKLVYSHKLTVELGQAFNLDHDT